MFFCGSGIHGYLLPVAVIGQARDLPAVVQKWAAPIRRGLSGIRARIAAGNSAAAAENCEVAWKEEVA
jgi:hypothetical protein